jgi:hypothetical protein
MTALIGLVGVIAGALLGGLVTYRVERRKLRDRAGGAALLIAGELADIVSRMKGVLEDGDTPWTGALPDRHWRAQIGNLAGFLKPATLEALIGVHGLLGRWTLTVEQAATLDRDALRKDADAIDAVSQSLTNWASGSRVGRAARSWGSGIAIAAVLAAIGFGLAALSWPEPDTSDQAVAAALESGLGPRSLVECLDRPGSNWRCTVHMLGRTRQACSLSLARPPATPARSLAADTATCPAPETPFQMDVSQNGSKVIAAPGAGYAARVHRVVEASLRRRNGFQRIWDKATGG